jgi:putative membrane protein
MMEEIWVRYAHFISIMVLTSTLLLENVLIAKTLSAASVRKLALIDGIYGLAALCVAISGVLLWMSVGKPKEFYSTNPIFHTKLALFVLVAVLSVLPTIFFLKHRKTSQMEIALPSYVITIKRLELVILIFIPLCAVMMARGIGLA